MPYIQIWLFLLIKKLLNIYNMGVVGEKGMNIVNSCSEELARKPKTTRCSFLYPILDGTLAVI